MSTPAIDYDALAQQHGGAPAAIDYDALAAQHGATNASDSGLVHGAKEFWNQVNPMNAVRGLAQLTYHPVDTLKADAAQRTAILDKGKQAYEKGNYTEAAAHLLYGMLPLLGPNLERSGEQFQQGDVAGGVGSSVGQGVAMAAPGAIKAAAPALVEGAASLATKPVLTAPVRLAARSAETAINQKLIPLRPLANIMTPADAAEATQFKVPGRDYGLPQTGGPVAAPPTPAPPPAAAPPAETPPPAPAPAPAAAPLVSPAVVAQQLEDALGGKPLQRGVPLRNQAQAAAKLPEGFTPVDSTALKGYKYDPTTQQFESVTKFGQHYVHGQVTPEQAATFEAADSKGAAWGELKNSPGVTYLGKVMNGKFIPAKPPMALRTAGELATPISATPASAPPAGTEVPTESTQLGLLQKMLEDALAKKAKAAQ